jgi:hypothetical protein
MVSKLHSVLTGSLIQNKSNKLPLRTERLYHSLRNCHSSRCSNTRPDTLLSPDGRSFAADLCSNKTKQNRRATQNFYENLIITSISYFKAITQQFRIYFIRYVMLCSRNSYFMS